MNGRRTLGGFVFWAMLLVLVATQVTHSSKVVKRNIRTARSVDQTRTPGAVGEDVVCATVNALDDSELFEADNDMMKRLALVLSDFGNDIDGSGEGASDLGDRGGRSGHSGGIWSIDATILTTATSNMDFFDHVVVTLGFGGVAPYALDTSVPLISAFLMRNFVSIMTNFTALPNSVEEQAQWFADNLGGNATEFIENVQAFEADNVCTPDKLDVWFLVDDTNSGSMAQFQDQLNLIAKTMEGLMVAQNSVHVGISTYFGGVIVNFTATTDFASFNSTLMGITYNGGATKNLATALTALADQFNTTNGARPLEQGVPRIVYVFASNSDEPDVLTPADALRAIGVTLYVVAYGSTGYVNPLVTDQVANDPNIEHTFIMDDFDNLQTLANRIRQTMCRVRIMILDETPVKIAVTPTNPLFATLTFPVGGSITITIVVTNNAGGVIYFSLDETAPNSAVNTLQVTLEPGTTTIILNDVMGELQLADLTRSKRDTGTDVSLNIAVESGMMPLEGSMNTEPRTEPFTISELVCAETITISFNQTALDELNASPGDILYVSQNQTDKPEDVAANCQVVVGGQTTLTFGLTECNPAVIQNFTGSKYQATFTVWRQPAVNLSLPIQRYKEYCKTFECVFSDELLLDSLSIVPKIMKVEKAPESNDGAFNLGTDLCSTSDCTSPLAAGSPVYVPDDVYVKISLVDLAAGINNFYVIMTSCWATKDADPNSVPRYQLITNKMATGGDIMILRNSQSTYAFFKFESFVWTNYTEMEQTISVHCDVTICDNDLTDCTMLRRRRRSLQTTGKLISSHQLQLRTHKAENEKCETMHGYCSDRCNDKEVGIECSCYEGRKLSVDGRTCYDNYAIKAFGNRDHQTLVLSSNNDWMLAAAVFICAVSMSMAAYVLWTVPRNYK